MAAPANTEVRAALRDETRVRIAISSGSAASGLRVMVDAADGKEPEVPIQQPRKRLSARELQVLQLVAQGLHNRQIAARIHRSIKTVEKHRQSLHLKLSTHEVAGLTRQALSMGLMNKTRAAALRLSKSAKQLTPREIEVLKLVAQGSGNKWIASELKRSIKTVDHHRENIMKKLGIHEVAGLTWYAFSCGLL